MNRIWAAWGAAALAFTAAAHAGESNADKAAAAKVAVELCSACHGPGGHSVSPTFPILAAQQPAYLAAQLKAFKSKERADPEAHDYMWGIAGTLNDALIDPLAQYFAAQKPAAGVPGDPALVAEGRTLYDKGIPNRKIPPCANCHGADAQGNSIFPRLAGQHKAYLVRQIQVIQERLRNSPIMHGIVTELRPNEINAVAEFLHSK